MRHDSHGRTATLKYTLYHATMTKTLTAPPIVANTRRLADSRASRLASLARPRLARTPRLMSRLAHAPRIVVAPRLALHTSPHEPLLAGAAPRTLQRTCTASRLAPCASLLARRSLRLDPPITPRSSPSAPESHRLKSPDNKHKNSVRGRARRWAKCGRSSNSPVDG